MRVFIAILLSDEVTTALAEYEERVTGALRTPSLLQFVPRTNVHMTIRFLGDVDETQLAVLYQLFEEVDATYDAFTLTLTQAGFFPRIFWMGAEKTDALYTLASAFELRLAHLGFGKADHPFKPHITLARAKFTIPHGVRRAIEEVAFHPVSSKVGEVVLMKSTLTGEGAVYTPLARCALKG